MSAAGTKLPADSMGKTAFQSNGIHFSPGFINRIQGYQGGLPPNAITKYQQEIRPVQVSKGRKLSERGKLHHAMCVYFQTYFAVLACSTFRRSLAPRRSWSSCLIIPAASSMG